MLSDEGAAVLSEAKRWSVAERLHIGIIAPPWVPVPPPVYGGTELVVDNLARGLVAAGHAVTLFATGDSTCPVERRWHYESALGTNVSLSSELAHIQAAYRTLCVVDVVHDHTLLGPLWAAVAFPELPVVTTAHGPFTPELAEHYRAIGAHAAVIAISHHQRATAPHVPVAAVIHHGIDVSAIPVGQGRGGYVLFLGRMSADKGAHTAITAARRAGKRIVLAAKMWEPAEHEYFARFVEPLLGADATYVGEVGGAEKVALIGGAEALVNPICWPEPFGLVMIEALACGTPVVALSEGAACEIVEHRRTGFLCATEDDLVEALGRVHTIDRQRCRAAAEERFSVRRMIAEHIALYRRLARDPWVDTVRQAAAMSPLVPSVDLAEATRVTQ